MAGWQAMNGHTFESQAFQDTVTALGRVAAMIPFLPSGTAIGNLASESGRAIAVSAAHGSGVSVFV